MQGGAKIRDTCEALKDVLDDFNIVFTEGGIHINSLDVNGVALVNATLWHHRFERYSCARTFVCGLNMAVLYKTFKPVNKATQLTLRIDEKYPTALAVCMENSGIGFKIDVTLKIWGSDKKMLKIENSVFDRYVTVPSGDFQSLIGYISNFQTSGDDDNKILDIELANGELVLSSRGQFGVARVAVKERNTGMNVSTGQIDPLDDQLVKREVDAEEAAAAAAALEKGNGSSGGGGGGGGKKKAKKTFLATDEGDLVEVDDGDESEGGEEVGKKRSRKPVSDEDDNGTGVPPAAPAAAPESTLAALAPPPHQGGGGIAPSTTTLIAHDDAVALIDQAPPVKNSYNLKYMRYFTKATPLSTSVRLFLRPNYPIIVMYNIGSMGVLRYCLGPASADDAEIDEQMDDDGDGDDGDDGPQAENED